MSDEINISRLTGKAKEIALKVDKENKEDGWLKGDEISIFYSEVRKQKVWNEIIPDFQQYVAERDATYVASRINPATNVRIAAKNNEQTAKAEEKILSKQEVCSKMYQKWASAFKDSPLKAGFYEKLYDVIETLNIKVSKWDKENYSSPEEQAMDEVIAIFAGESKLNPRTKSGIYNGLFQLAAPGLKEAKMWAKKNRNVPGMQNIRDNMTISQFRYSSGELQLDYMVAYIGKCKEYSKIGEDDSITPTQLWVMIKYPFKGKDKGLIHQKSDSIQSVFKNSKIELGI